MRILAPAPHLSIDGASVTYDALGRMVEQNSGGAYTQIVYTPAGAKLALMNGTTVQKAFVSLPGGSVAVYNSSGLAYYRYSDHLSSSRFASTPSRAMYYDGAYGPFGEPYAQTGTADVSFTGMNQDTVPNLYDFPAREYGTQGRWPSPDPAGLSSVHLRDPQTWNRYAYVRNSPLAIVDPTGEHLFTIQELEAGADLGGGPGSGGWCTIDGAYYGCGGPAFGIIPGEGAEVPCPNNICDGFTKSGQYFQFVAGAGGASGYVRFSDIVQGMYEANGTFMSDAQYNAYVLRTYGSQIEAQREALAWAIVVNYSGPGEISYQDAYDSLKPSGGYLWDRNYNFVSTTYDSGDLSCGADASRCNGIHFPGGQDANGNFYVHLDSSNPFTGLLAFAEHSFVDVFLPIFVYTVIPRPWP